MYANQDQEEVQYDLGKPLIAVYKNTWRIHQNTVYWCNLKLAQRKGLQFYQTRSKTKRTKREVRGNNSSESRPKDIFFKKKKKTDSTVRESPEP